MSLCRCVHGIGGLRHLLAIKFVIQDTVQALCPEFIDLIEAEKKQL